MISVLALEDNEQDRLMIREAIEYEPDMVIDFVRDAGGEVTVEAGLRKLAEKSFHVLLLDLAWSREDEDLYSRLAMKRDEDLLHIPSSQAPSALRFLDKLRQQRVRLPVIVLSQFGKPQVIKLAMQKGAYWFVDKTDDPSQLVQLIRKAKERWDLEEENARLRSDFLERYSSSKIVARSSTMSDALDMIKSVAESPRVSALVFGEKGTGKEFVARVIHSVATAGEEGPFIRIDCESTPKAILSERYIESQLERGVGGTVFIRRVDLLDLRTQDAIADVASKRIGNPLHLVCSTIGDPRVLVEEHTLSPRVIDVLGMVAIRVPALRERREDIPELVRQFKMSLVPEGLRLPSVLYRRLLANEWERNVEELQATVSFLVALAEDVGEVDESFLAALRDPEDQDDEVARDGLSLQERLRRAEHIALVDALRRADGVRREAAEILGVTESQMKYLVRKHALQRKKPV